MESFVDLAFSPPCELSPNKASSSPDDELEAGMEFSACGDVAELAVLDTGFCVVATPMDGEGPETKLLNISSLDILGPFELGAGSSTKEKTR